MRVVYVSTLERGGPLSHLRAARAARRRARAPRYASSAPTEAIAERFRAPRRRGRGGSARAQARRCSAPRRLWPLLRGRRRRAHARPPRRPVRPARAAGSAARTCVHTLHGIPEEIAPRLGRPDAPDPPGVSRRPARSGSSTATCALEAALTRLGARRRALAGDGRLPARARLPAAAAARDPATASTPASRPSVRPTAPARHDRRRGEPRALEGDRRAARGVRAWPTCPARLEVFGDGALRGALERQASEAGVDARFHGFVADLRERLAELDVLRPAVAGRQPAGLDPRGDGRRPAGRRARASAAFPELVVDGETGSARRARGRRRALAAALDAARRATRTGASGSAARPPSGSRRALLARSDVARRMVALYERLCAILHVIQELRHRAAPSRSSSSLAEARARPATRSASRPRRAARRAAGKRSRFPLPLVERRPWRMPGRRECGSPRSPASPGPTSCTRTTRAWPRQPLSPRFAAAGRPGS